MMSELKTINRYFNVYVIWPLLQKLLMLAFFLNILSSFYFSINQFMENKIQKIGEKNHRNLTLPQTSA